MSKEIGEILKGKITSITKFGAFVSLSDARSGMVHISEISDSYVKDINDFVKVGQEVTVKICSVDEKGRLALSIKQAKPKTSEVGVKDVSRDKKTIPEEIAEKKPSHDSFEDMMNKFMKTSNEKMSDLRKTMDSKISSPGFSRKNSKKY